MTHRINILGVPIDSTTLEETLTTIKNNLKRGIKTFIATPNPEMILASVKDSTFKKILSETDLNIADGIGILWAATYLHQTRNIKSRILKIIIALYYSPLIVLHPSSLRQILPERVTGSDLMKKICQNPAQNMKVFLLGGQPHVTTKTKEILEFQYNIKVVGTDSSIAELHNDSALITKINKSDANVLFVAYGAPKQEMWLYRNLPHLQTVKISIGVGGAFDFLCGEIPRAPKIMRDLGLEWLFRLFKQPSRIKRIYFASIKFPLKIISSSF